jgi:hypothetical protein
MGKDFLAEVLGRAPCLFTAHDLAELGVAYSATFCPHSFVDLNRERIDTRQAYGAGLQVTLTRFAIRAEYERVSASTGDPSLMSLGLIWRFD